MSSRDWSQLVDASWQKIESIFDVKTTTPPIQRSVPRTPLAPRKKLPPPESPRVRRRRLIPRKLTYETENIIARASPAAQQQQQISDSGVLLWAATSSASMQPEDANKENRPESGKGTKGRVKTQSMLAPVKGAEARSRRKDGGGGGGGSVQSGFRPIRI